jgi:DNA polymerase
MVAHHVALAQPRRILVLGRNILPLCGHDPAQSAQKLHSFNHEGGRVPALFAEGLGQLLEKPRLRARLWQRWLDWTDG